MRMWGLLVVLVAFPSAAHAEEEVKAEKSASVDDVESRARGPATGFAFGTGAYVFAPSLGDARFEGSGVPASGGARTGFRHTGRELGVGRPALVALEMRADLLWRYLDLGLHVSFAGHAGGGGTPTDPEAAAQVSASSVEALGGGIHAAVHLPVGPIDLFAGPDVGYRGYSVPLTGFRPTVCHYKGRTMSCPEEANALLGYFEPRIGLTWNAPRAWQRTPANTRRRSSARAGFFATIWLGGDLGPAPSVAGGVTFGFAAVEY